ncbi:hypothetical protein KVV02_001534 [Mortierella alpina]|uniref:Methyltransferase-domain-containing protein n=1 Tax=Mortierella alpina TaxID=64518 RepID=A0A9P7ZYF5_MORAP|nr:hypothetical protein KVV02_001534 [Mortierella alpina]
MSMPIVEALSDCSFFKANPRLDQSVTINQNTGNVVWDGAYLMAKHIETHLGDLQGKTCLELGAGTGLVSIVAWLMGASRVVATDLPGSHLEHLKKNISLNTRRIESAQRQAIITTGVQEYNSGSVSKKSPVLDNESLQVTSLDWNTPVLPDALQDPYSYILCSEILYLPQQHRALLKTIAAFADERTIVVLLWKDRGLGEERFFDLASRASGGWTIEHLPASELDYEFRSQPYKIAKMTKK